MKVKTVYIILLISLALNLSVVGTVLYNRVLRHDHPFRNEHFRNDDFPRLSKMDLTKEQRDQMKKMFFEFMEKNKETMVKMHDLEKQLADELKKDDTDTSTTAATLEKLSQLKLEQSKLAVRHFMKIKKFLSPQQRERILHMIIESRPSRGHFVPNRRFPKDDPFPGPPPGEELPGKDQITE